MVRVSRLTPEALLSAPRRSAGIPNAKGDLVLYTVSAYSFQSHSKTSQIRVLNLADGSSCLLSDDHAASDPVWLGDDDVAFIKASTNGCTTIVSQSARADSPHAHMIHHFAGSVSNMKTRQLPCGSIAFCCSALTTPSGDMYWPAVESKSHSSAKIYSSLFARHWDSWSTPNHNSLWYGLLAKKDDKWTLQSPGVVNLLAGTRLSCPVAPFGDTGDFDLCASGIAFVAKDPDLNAARYTKSDLYYAPVPSFTEKPAALHRVETGRLRGYSLCPTFSRDGKKLAFARMRSDQYESDKPHLLLIPDITDLANVQEFYETADGVGSWDLRPEWITWSHDDSELYVAAEKHARGVLFRLPSSPVQANSLPTPIYEDGSVADAKVLGGSPSLFLSCKSLVESSCYCIVDPDTKSVKEISSISKRGKLLGLSRSQCSEIWYPGSRGYRNHALVMRPSDFDSSKKYPLAFLIHGGPQGAWSDDWSTRWNPGIFAEQGYVVVAPNPTGSTGYGQDHVDAIAGNWGGSPYEDLVKCFDYIEEEMKYVDTDRAVALGASYGGYMINWIQGHDLGRKFKCLVCHDGVFSTLNQWSTEELFFPEHDFCGTLWGRRDMYEKWDPARHTGNWATPELVIHNELDYRLPVSEGLAMFNVLQARGVSSKLVVFPDENHWVLKPENSLVWHREVLAWINRYTGIADETNLEPQTAQLAV